MAIWCLQTDTTNYNTPVQQLVDTWLGSISEEMNPVTTRLTKTSEITFDTLSYYTEISVDNKKVAVQATIEKFDFPTYKCTKLQTGVGNPNHF